MLLKGEWYLTHYKKDKSSLLHNSYLIICKYGTVQWYSFSKRRMDLKIAGEAFSKANHKINSNLAWTPDQPPWCSWSCPHCQSHSFGWQHNGPREADQYPSRKQDMSTCPTTFFNIQIPAMVLSSGWVNFHFRLSFPIIFSFCNIYYCTEHVDFLPRTHCSFRPSPFPCKHPQGCQCCPPTPWWGRSSPGCCRCGGSSSWCANSGWSWTQRGSWSGQSEKL